MLKKQFTKIFKSTCISSGLVIASLCSSPQIAKAEDMSMSACPESGSDQATLAYIEENLNGECLFTPEQYKLTIYEMGLCTEPPTTATGFSKDNCVETMLSESGTEVDLAPGSSSTKMAALPSAKTRPAAGRYTYAYILLGNGFKMKGSYTIKDEAGNSIVYRSKPETDSWGSYGAAVVDGAPAEEHIDLVDNLYFGQCLEEPCWDGEMTATPMPGGGNVSALLLKECFRETCEGASGLAGAQGEVKRLLGIFQPNAGSPVVITDSTKGVEVELVVKADPSNPASSGGGYLIYGYDDGTSWDLRGFGSAPFKPKFTVF